MIKLNGIITAIITPFDNDKLDFNCFESLIIKQIETQIDGIVVAGSTGEGMLLTKEEYEQLLHCAINISRGKIPIIACCSHSSTRYVLELIKIAEKMQVSALLCTVPNYVKPSQNGILQHFYNIHSNTSLPIILYNIPGRTCVEMSDETIIELSKLPRVIGIKDSGNDFIRPMRLKIQNFSILAGDDINALMSYAHGAIGLVSVLSNLAPKTIKNIYTSFSENRVKESLELQKKLLPLYQVLSIEPNPVSIKYVMSLFNLCKPDIRLPLCLPSNQNQEIFIKTINKLRDLLL